MQPQEKKKKLSLATKSLLRVAGFGIAIALLACVVSGIEFYVRNMEEYTDLAYSYAYLATLNISGDLINDLLDHKDEITGYLNAQEGGEYLISRKTIESDPDLDNELRECLLSWYDTRELFLSIGVLNSNIKYFYVVIPAPDDLIYLWDSDLSQGKMTALFEHDAYSDGEKENLMRVINNDNWNEKLVIYNEAGEILGTAMTPIFDKDNNTVAVAAVDLPLTDIRRRFRKLMIILIGSVAIGLAVCCLIYYRLMLKGIIRPILKMREATSGIVDDLKNKTEKNLNIDIHTGDEIEELADSFEEMGRNLKTYIVENEAITSEKERIDTELNLAAALQKDMVPNNFPAFPERSEFEVYASMTPAREVGGDFYDFFFIDENRLCLVMADVSGKGIPAALFMMKAMILIKDYSLDGLSPADMLAKVNDMICRNNRIDMFVTVWVGILDLKSGLLTAANAGHEYPIVKTPEGKFELYKDKHSFIVGGQEGIRYKQYELYLEPGSKVFLYTDGVPEATKEGDLQFGLERTIDALNSAAEGSPQKILMAVDLAVKDFVKDAPQFDDLTMMCIHYKGDSTEK